MSNVLSQKEAVFQALLSVFGEITGNLCKPSKEQKANVIGIVTQGIMSGAVDFSAKARAKHNTEESVSKYVEGMVSNWLRKDTRLNGGTEYETKNPGSRSFSTDPEVSAMRKLILKLKAEGNDDGVAEVTEVLNAKLEALKAARPTKAKNIEINADLIPADLQHLIAQ